MAKFNPFRPNGLVPPGIFSGRYEEIRRIEQALFQTKHGNPQHVLLEGERGIGKSSLFLLSDMLANGHLKTMDGNTLKFIVVNVELREMMGHGDIIDRILGELRRQISQREPVKQVCLKAWDFLNKFEAYGIRYRQNENEARREGLNDLTDTLVDVQSDAKDQIDGIFILIDEGDKPAVSAHLGELCKLLTERLAFRRAERVAIGLAGLPGLIAKLRTSHESSPRVFSTLSLDTLKDKERVEVIHRGLDVAASTNGFRTKIAEDAVKLIADLSEGYPHFLQQFSYCAFDMDTDDDINMADVANGVVTEHGALEQLGQRYFADLYIDQIGSEDYRRVLVSMATKMDGWIKRPEIIALSGVKERIVDNALHALKDRRIIIASDRERGEYRLPTKAFAIWIRVRESARKAQENQEAPLLALMEARDDLAKEG
jgi:hypothetical protein